VTRDGRVTVVVLTHDRRTEVLRTLRRLQALPEQPSIVVVDSGSSDGTAEAVRGAFPRVELVLLDENLGAAGRNVGIAHAATPYVALCDDDTSWSPGALTRAADLLDADRGLALLTARVLVGPEERTDPTCLMMAQSPLAELPGQPCVPVLGFLAGATVVRRDAILSAGGFDPRLFLGGEEWLLAVDLAAAGWRLAYAEDVVVHHYPSATRDTPRRDWIEARNRVWLAWLRRPAAVAVATTWRVLAAHRMRRQVAAAVLRGLPWVLRERRLLPPHVERWQRLLDASRGVTGSQS
jgi:GT2 family glycosyltransferase